MRPLDIVAADGPAHVRPTRLLLVDCPDRRGLIHQITGLLAAAGANIVTNAEFVDTDSGRFFMRTEFAGGEPVAALVDELRTVLPPAANVRLGGVGSRRVVVLVSSEHHCLGELLLRHAHDELGADILAVVGNHTVLATLTTRFNVPFHHVPHAGVSRHEHERALEDVLAAYEPDYLVLAKYMRVLTPDFVGRYAQRIINIHHSFLPAFAGSNPYRQAFERGVKIIGATAHFVTEGLDEGPIIAQAVVPIDHSHRLEEMTRAGRDVEKIVLARALKLVFEERVFLNGRRTVVFD
jgi:formyltetrahydrofolate deformylase